MATRTPVRGRTPAAADTPTVKSSFRGAAGMRAMEQEQERSEASREAARNNAGQPFRYFTPVSETRSIIIVDDAPDFWRFEHAIQNPRSKKWDTFLPCIDAEANCPACENTDRPAYFAMYLTVIDLTPYETKDGETVEFSKKLLVIKPMQQKKITRLYERHKTLRGMYLECTRDSKTDAAIGDMEFVEFVDEEELATYQSVYIDKEKKTHEIDCSAPYDYEALFPDVTEKQLRAMVGGRAGIGSRDDEDSAIGRGGRSGFKEDDEAPPVRRAASRTGRAAPEPEEEEEEEAPPRRGAAPAARTAVRPAAPVTRSRQAIDPDDSPDAGAEEDEPPFKGGSARRGAAPASRTPAPPVRGTTRRAAPVVEEEEEEEDEAPQRPVRGGADVTARRASLRRG